MTKKFVKQLLMVVFTFLLFSVPAVTANAAQVEETTEDAEETERTPLTFDIEFFSYEIVDDATQEDMPKGFTLGDWEYNGVAVKAGFTENCDMVCVVGEDWETGYKYKFIYDPAHEMFVPYFGADIKNGYIYTIPMYEDAEVPYGFVEAYFVIQTVPMFTYMREDAELTQEEIAVGSLSEDNYLVFLMMDENGKEVHYTYDLIDRTFQRALLQKKDAEKVTELNEVIDELHSDIGELNAINAARMNKRLTVIGILIALLLIMAGVIVNLLLKISKLKDEEDSDEFFDEETSEEDEEDEEIVEDEDGFVYETSGKKGLKDFLFKTKFYDEEDLDDSEEELDEEVEESLEETCDEELEKEVNDKSLGVAMHLDFPHIFDDDDIEFLDLDLEEL